MKRTLFILALMSCAAGIMAQKRSFFRVEAGYANTRMVTDIENGRPLHGGQISLLAGCRLTDRLYVESGVTAMLAAYDSQESYPLVVARVFVRNYNSASGNYASEETIWTDVHNHEQKKSMSVGIPVNFGLRFPLAENFTLQPYLGVALNYGIRGKYEYRTIYDDRSFPSTYGYSGFPGKIEEGDVDWYTGSGSDYEGCDRFRFSGQAGLQLRWQDWSLSYQYQCDITRMETTLHSRFRTSTVSIGYYF